MILTRRHAVIRAHPNGHLAVRFYGPGDEANFKTLSTDPIGALEPFYELWADAFAAAWSGRFGEEGTVPEFVHMAPDAAAHRASVNYSTMWDRHLLREDSYLIGEPPPEPTQLSPEVGNGQPPEQEQITHSCVYCGSVVVPQFAGVHNDWHEALTNIMASWKLAIPALGQQVDRLVSQKIEVSPDGGG